jgi:hypothetical protein
VSRRVSLHSGKRNKTRTKPRRKKNLLSHKNKNSHFRFFITSEGKSAKERRKEQVM